MYYSTKRVDFIFLQLECTCHAVWMEYQHQCVHFFKQFHLFWLKGDKCHIHHYKCVFWWQSTGILPDESFLFGLLLMRQSQQKSSAFSSAEMFKKPKMANSVDPDQTAPIICSWSTLFASMLNSLVMLGNCLQQTTSEDDIFRCILFLAL